MPAGLMPIATGIERMNDPRIAGAPARKSNIRRLAVTIAAAIGLLAMSSAAIAETAGTISGFVFKLSVKKTKAAAIAADGTRYEVTVKRNGYYRINNLPPGTYELEFSQGETMWFDGAEVKSAKETVVNTTNPNGK